MKLAQDMPGAFQQSDPYAMRKRVLQGLGSPPTAKPKARTQIGTVGSSTGTVEGPKPAGMGRMKGAAVYKPGALEMLKHVRESLKRLGRLAEKTEKGTSLPVNIAEVLAGPLKAMEKAPPVTEHVGRQFFVKIPGERRIIGHVTPKGELSPHTVYGKKEKLDPTKAHLDLTELVFGRPKTSQANPMTKQKNLLGGGPAVGPRMRTVAKPMKPMTIRTASAYPSGEEALDALLNPDIDGALLTKEGQHQRMIHALDVLRQLESTSDPEEKLACIVELAGIRKEAFLGALARGAGALFSRAAPAVGGMLRSRKFWTGAGIAGGGYGAYKLIKGMGGRVEQAERTRKQKLETPLPRP